jgi:hypothetical protein
LAQRDAAGYWAPVQEAHSFQEATHRVALSAWSQVVRRFRDAHTERWWATELTLLGHGPERDARAICATTNRRKLPDLSTWYLTTTLSVEQAPLKEVVRLYELRNWVEQSYKQTKDDLGWADFLVRSHRAIRRHWILMYFAFSFCWWHETNRGRAIDRSLQPALPPVPSTGRKKISSVNPCLCWTKTLRPVRAWLFPAHWLTHCWRAFANQPPPCAFDSLLHMPMRGDGINLYL